MKHRLLAFACALLASAAAYGQADVLGGLTENVNIEGLETQFDPATGVATAKGEVHIIYGDVEIKAGQADYNTNTGDIVARENVTVVKAGEIFRGENVIYNLRTEELKANNLRSALPPILYDTDGFSTNAGKLERIDGTVSYFTTHDSKDPNWRVSSKQITIYPEDKIVMRNVKVYAGDTPIFWLPLLVQPLDDELGYFFQPGYTSQWGAFLLNQYGIMHSDHTLAKYRLDLRSARGVAVGADYRSMKWKELKNENIGWLKLYYAYDTDPTLGVNDITRPDNLVDENRYRIAFQHRIFIPGPAESTWYLDFDITKLSDQFMLEDYYLNEFRTDPEPDNHIKLVKRADSFTATLLARMQVNDFFHTDSRLPELAFDFTRSPLWNTGIYYQGETSIGSYTENLTEGEREVLEASISANRTLLSSIGKTAVDANGALVPIAARDAVEDELQSLQDALDENKFKRLYSYHEFLYPMSFGASNWINFVPRIGGGLAYYDSIEGMGPDVPDSDTKPIFHAGFDFSLKFSKTWDDVQNRAIGIDGLRHIVQPYLNYSYLEADSIEGLEGIDRLSRTTRARAIDVPLFTATDDLNTWNVARVGVRNTFQTKRDDATYNYAGLNSYIDLFAEDPEFNRSVSNLYNELFWAPLPWLSLNIDFQLPVGDGDYSYTEVNSSLTWMPTKRLSWSVGHNFLTDNPLFRDSSLIFSRVYAKLNENWGFSATHVYEMEDSTMQYQSYSVHRDLASWTVGVGGLIRDNIIEKEYGVVLTFTLKDFPNVSIPLDLDPNPTGVGGAE